MNEFKLEYISNNPAEMFLNLNIYANNTPMKVSLADIKEINECLFELYETIKENTPTNSQLLKYSQGIKNVIETNINKLLFSGEEHTYFDLKESFDDFIWNEWSPEYTSECAMRILKYLVKTVLELNDIGVKEYYEADLSNEFIIYIFNKQDNKGE